MDGTTPEPLFESALTVRLSHTAGQSSLFVEDEAVQLETLGTALLHRSGHKPCPLNVRVHKPVTDTSENRTAFLAYIRAVQAILHQQHFNTIHYRTL